MFKFIHTRIPYRRIALNSKPCLMLVHLHTKFKIDDSKFAQLRLAIIFLFQYKIHWPINHIGIQFNIMKFAKVRTPGHKKKFQTSS